jgi:hypothetical protein
MTDVKQTAEIGKGKPGPGRPKGVPNKSTTALKDAILGAFDAVGGQTYLQGVADTDPKTFCTLLGKVLPTEVKADVNGNITVNVLRFTNA